MLVVHCFPTLSETYDNKKKNIVLICQANFKFVIHANTKCACKLHIESCKTNVFEYSSGGRPSTNLTLFPFPRSLTYEMFTLRLKQILFSVTAF